MLIQPICADEIRKMPQIRSLLGLFFRLFYHPFAWTYDLVAAVVSLGRWQGWVLRAQPYLSGRVLEIGYGPGHLQVALDASGLEAFGLDESRQMSRQAGWRLRKKGYPPGLARGMAQHIPFPENTFESVAATHKRFKQTRRLEDPQLHVLHCAFLYLDV